MDYLTLGLKAAYLDAEYDEYKDTFCKVIGIDGTLADPTCVNGQGDLSGERLERAPEWEGTVSFDWDSPLTERTRLRVNGALSYSDDYYIQANVSPLYTQDSFTKTDLRVAVADAEDRWEVALIGRNIFDELTLQHAFQVGRYHAASLSTPRYVTLQGTWRFQ
jgi:iron complex outermembrane receptor protein